jgi:hypothetical protein
VVAVPEETGSLPYDRRPTDHTPVHTTDLPPTPTRDRNIPATAWVEAPDELRALGEDLEGRPVAEYKRRIGPWLLWRAGPARRARARYWAGHEEDPSRTCVLDLRPDGSADGVGPSGAHHERFRSWKQDLLDTP